MTTKSLNDGAGSSPAAALSCLRSSTASSMSTSSVITKSGAVALDSAIRRATVRCRRVSSCVGDVAAAGLAVAARRFAAPAPPWPRRFRARPRAPARRPCARGLDVGLDDPPARPGALDRRELEAQLARHPPRDRRRLHALAVLPARPSASAALLGASSLGLRPRLRRPRARRRLVARVLVVRLLVLVARTRRSSSCVLARRPRPRLLVLRLVSRPRRRPTTPPPPSPMLRDRLADRRACRPPWPRSRACPPRRPRRSCWPCPSRSRRAPRPWNLVAVGLQPLEDRALLHGVGQAGHRDVGHGPVSSLPGGEA